MKKTLSLTDGKVLNSLLKFTVPILFTILLQTAYGTADLLIVGQFATVADVSGVTIGSQILQTITAIFIGLSMGTTILIARYIGSNKHEKCSAVVGTSLTLFASLAVFTTIIVVLFRSNIASIMQTPSDSLQQTKSYLLITGIGVVFIVAYNLVGSIFRGIGDSKTPLMTVAIACVVNIILDIIFVKSFNLGASGAALATVIAQATSVILSLIIISKKSLPFTFYKKDIKFNKKYTAEILKLGIPVATQSALVSVSFLAVTSIINIFGVAASAAVGIVEKITGLVMVVPQAFMQSLCAFTAQNYGANQLKRAKTALAYAISFSVCFGIITAYLCAFHGTIFTQIFTSDIDVTLNALDYLKSYSIDCVLVAFMFCFSGYFNGCGKTTFVMFHSIFSAFLIRIPLAYMISHLENTSLFLIGLATPSSTFIQIIMCVVFYYYTKNKISSSQTA